MAIVLPERLAGSFRLDAEMQLLMCEHCKSALLPSSVARHVSETLKLPIELRKAIQDFAQQLPQYTLDTVPLRPNNSPIISNWPIHEGFICLSCNYIQCSKQMVLRHARKEHDKPKCPEASCIKRVWVQTWFASRRARYWVVDDKSFEKAKAKAEQVQKEDDGLEKIRRQEKERLAEVASQRGIITNTKNRDDTDEWLIRTGWKELFAGRTRATIVAAKESPADNEVPLQWVCKIFDRLVRRAIQTLEQTPREILRWLQSPKLEEAHVRPFTVLHGDGTIKRYTGHWKDFLCYCMRTSAMTAEERAKEHGIRFTAYQLRLLQAIFKACEDLGPATTTVCQYSVSGREREVEEGVEEEEGQAERYLDSTDNPITAEDWQESSIEERVTMIEDLLFDFCTNVLQHRFRTGDVYENALVFFTAVLGIDVKHEEWRRPEDYTYHLAGISWVNRLLMLELALPLRMYPISGIAAREAYKDFGERMHHIRKQHLVDGSYSPQSEILSLLAKGKNIAKRRGGYTSIVWSADGKTLGFKGKPITMDGFRAMIRAVLGEAEDMLKNKLMFGEQPDVDLSSITDSMKFSKNGHWFIDLPDNKIDSNAEFLLQKAATCPDKRRLFRNIRRSGSTQSTTQEWHDMKRKAYIKDVKRFQELLFVLMHFTGGQPARGPEIGSVKIRNTGNTQRSIYVLNGEVMFITEYDKKRDVTLETSYIARYLPAAIGQMLVTYLIYVLPFHELVCNSIRKTTEVNDYLFGSPESPWIGRKLSGLLRRESRRHLGVEMGIRDFRQVIIAIAKMHLTDIISIIERYNPKDKGDDEDSSDDDDDGGGDMNGSHVSTTMLHAQSAHGRQMGKTHYAINSAFLHQLQPELLIEFRKVSVRLHEFLGLLPLSSKSQKTKRQRATSTIDQVAGGSGRQFKITAKESQQGYQRRRHISASIDALQDQMQAGLIRLYGYDAKFRSDAQEQCMKAVLRSRSKLIIVMGTAEGKSLLYMLPAVLPGRGTVIVIAPFTALVENIEQRCLQFGIDAVQWEYGLSHPHALVIVSADIAITDSFMAYALDLQFQGLLRHVFFDECHVCFKDIDYRVALRSSSRIRDLEVPTTMLTATMPIPLEWEFRHTMLMLDATILRFPTYRANISYRVLRCEPGKTVTVAVKLCKDTQESMISAEQKGILYCRSRNQCKTLSKLLDSAYYISGDGGNIAALRTWLESRKSSSDNGDDSSGSGVWITATGALGTGVDLEALIVAILHVGRPYGLIEYVQQSGRGGRKGDPTLAYSIIDPFSVDMEGQRLDQTLNNIHNIDEEWLQRYLTTGECRRKVIGEYMDGQAVSCADISGALCDNCLAKKEEAERKKPRPAVLTPYRQQVAQKSRKNEELLELLREYSRLCIYCLLQMDVGWTTHSYINCKAVWLEKELDDGVDMTYGRYREWRRQLQLQPFDSCYRCGLPQTICRSQEEEEECEWADVVLPLIFIGWMNGELLPYIKAKFKAELRTEIQLLRWLAGSDFWQGEDMGRIMMVFTCVGPELLERATEMAAK